MNATTTRRCDVTTSTNQIAGHTTCACGADVEIVDCRVIPHDRPMPAAGDICTKMLDFVLDALDRDDDVREAIEMPPWRDIAPIVDELVIAWVVDIDPDGDGQSYVFGPDVVDVTLAAVVA